MNDNENLLREKKIIEERKIVEKEERRPPTPPPKRKVPETNMGEIGYTATEEGACTVFELPGEIPVTPKIREHEEEPQMFQEETVIKKQFYEMEGILHKQTGEILTFVEAVRQGLLDLHSGGGEFYDIVSGRISLEKAVELGYVDGKLPEVLNQHYGIHHPDTKDSLSLLEAIQIGLYDPDTRQLRNIKTGETLSMQECIEKGILTVQTQYWLVRANILKLPPISLEEALNRCVVDRETGDFTGRYTGEKIPLKEALYYGYVQISGLRPMQKFAISLSDSIYYGFIDAMSGEFYDKNSGEKFTLEDAVVSEKPLVSLFMKEIINTVEEKKVTLKEAIKTNVVLPREGKYNDLQASRNLSFREAFDKDLIQKPMTLTEISERGLIDSTHKFIDAGTKHRYTLLEALAGGLLDPEVRHIIDPDSKEVISISEALERGLLEPDGKILVEEDKSFTVPEAVHAGLLTKRVRHSIFDIKGIRNTVTKELLNFNEAVEALIIIPQAERVVDLASGEGFSFADARGKEIIDPILYDLLNSNIGILDGNGREISLFRAVSKGLIDSAKSVYLHHNKELSPRQAYETGLLSLRGALQLTALFDIHPSIITPSQKYEFKRRIHRPGQPANIAADQVKVTLAEAMKQGLIDAKTHRFRQGDTEMSFEDALSHGFIHPSDEWIIPSRNTEAGPTIEEKVNETVTETGQQLGQKYYPKIDGNVEESVTTIQRVKTTETTAVGGPGGVSTYRAITGGKGALEVPTNGFHLNEAEQKGYIDLKTGIVTLPNVERKLTFEEAIKFGVLNGNGVFYKDPVTNKKIPIKESLERRLVNTNGSVKDNGQLIDLQTAIERQLIVIDPGDSSQGSANNRKVIQFAPGSNVVVSFRPVGDSVVEESEHSWSFDASRGEVVDHITGECLLLDTAIDRGVIASSDLLVHDTLTGREMTFAEAEKWGVIDKKNRYYFDKVESKRYSFAEAAKQHRIYPAGGAPENAADAVFTTVKVQKRSEVTKKQALSSGQNGVMSLNKLLSLGLYDTKDGKFFHPASNKSVTLKQAIIEGMIDPYQTVVVDRRGDRELLMIDGISEGIVNDEAGTIRDTVSHKTYDLKTAMKEGLIRDKIVAESFEDALVKGKLDLYSGMFTDQDGKKLPLQEAITKNLIESSTIIIRDPITGEETSFPEAVSKGIVNNKDGIVYNKNTAEKMSFPQALSSGIIAGIGSRPRTAPSTGHPRIVERSLQMTPFSPPIQSNEASLAFPSTDNNRENHVFHLPNGNKAVVKMVRNENGVEKGEYFDPSSGMKFTYQMQGDPYLTKTETKVRSTSQVRSIDVEPHAELVGIDRVKDKRSGRVMSLQEAQRHGLVHVDKKGKETTRTYSVFRSNLSNAIEEGVVDQDGEKISLGDAIRAKLIDIVNLKYNSRRTGELTLEHAANMGYLDATLSDVLPKGIYNPANGDRISTKSAVSLGLIDLKTGEVRNPWSGKKLSWIDVLKPVYVSLTKEGVYDPAKGYRIPILSAIVEELIDTNKELYCNRITGQKINLNEAVEHGLIDPDTVKAIKEPFLVDYKNQKELNFLEAVREKLVDPRNRTVQLGEHVIVPIARATADGKIPQAIGELLKRVDKMNFAEALGKGLIDVRQDCFTDPETGRQMPISQAIIEGYIDTGSVAAAEGSDETNLTNVLFSSAFDEISGRVREKKTDLNLTFEDAVARGVIDGNSLLHSFDYNETMTLQQAMNTKRITPNGQYVEAKTGRTYTLKEAVDRDLIVLIPSPMQAAQKVTEAVKRRDAEGYKFKIEPAENWKSKTSSPLWREESSVIKVSIPHREIHTETISQNSESGSDIGSGETSVRSWTKSWQGKTSELRQPQNSSSHVYFSSATTPLPNPSLWSRHE